MSISGFSLIGGQAATAAGATFSGINPATGEKLEPLFHTASLEEVEQAAAAAAAAAPVFGALSGKERGVFLRAIADGLTADAEAIIARAQLESGLPLPRLQGEMGRTTGQLKLFAEVIEEGSWLDARIDAALPERKPLPRSDIRSMLRPIGPVVVFGASNFPLAFSVAGGDTASALAAGNPVMVKAHPAHPGTSALVGAVIQKAVAAAGLPEGVFSLLFDAGVAVAQAVVKHPAVKAVGFTGSAGAGKALTRLCNEREEPIPCYAEMGSTNPLFILPGAMKERAAGIAAGLQGSFTLGSGQFCTKPGLVFLPGGSSEFVDALKTGVDAMGGHGMLTPGIASKYTEGVAERVKSGKAEFVAGTQAAGEGQTPVDCAKGQAAVFAVSLAQFMAEKDLEEEIFGPTTMLIYYDSVDELPAAAAKLHGHLTATLHANAEDAAGAGKLIAELETKVGRILFNGFPTGVEVCHAMVHGGPFPATSDTRTTSVGTRAILRFARPVCYQDFPDAALPAELRAGNPLGIMRMVNGKLERE